MQSQAFESRSATGQMWNALIERSNRTYRAEVLNAYVCESLDRSKKVARNGYAVTTNIDPLRVTYVSSP